VGIDPLRVVLGETRRGAPVYLAVGADRKIASVYATHPVGPLLRLSPPGHDPPRLYDLHALNERLFRGLLRRGEPPDPKLDPEGAVLLETYARTWRDIARQLHRAGERRAALQALARANDWAPWLAVPDWFSPMGRFPAPRLPR
jgi:hypothetical protein